MYVFLNQIFWVLPAFSLSVKVCTLLRLAFLLNILIPVLPHLRTEHPPLAAAQYSLDDCPTTYVPLFLHCDHISPSAFFCGWRGDGWTSGHPFRHIWPLVAGFHWISTAWCVAGEGWGNYTPEARKRKSSNNPFAWWTQGTWTHSSPFSRTSPREPHVSAAVANGNMSVSLPLPFPTRS